MKRIHYFDFPELKGIYLEDSFVLDVQTTDTNVTLVIDVVLTEQHPLYSAPLKNEHYCFRKAKLLLSNAKEVHWVHRKMQPLIDANSEIDYGSIDSFFLQGDIYYISGEWGEIRIKGSNLSFEFE